MHVLLCPLCTILIDKVVYNYSFRFVERLRPNTGIGREQICTVSPSGVNIPAMNRSMNDIPKTIFKTTLSTVAVKPRQYRSLRTTTRFNVASKWNSWFETDFRLKSTEGRDYCFQSGWRNDWSAKSGILSLEKLLYRSLGLPTVGGVMDSDAKENIVIAHSPSMATVSWSLIGMLRSDST